MRTYTTTASLHQHITSPKILHNPTPPLLSHRTAVLLDSPHSTTFTQSEQTMSSFDGGCEDDDAIGGGSDGGGGGFLSVVSVVSDGGGCSELLQEMEENERFVACCADNHMLLQHQ